ncbi:MULTISPECIES: restriction endonuclease subunit S [Leuconostoc]|uniref:restriction endonuclease subunit S n=1 Tax=Leuconostoc TaxID=1243 RepID=UPI002362D4BD|nr:MULTISPECIES: restriction endonuclease subunit S [Leuconostoc]
MQTKKRKSPSLRFRGYTDDWEERKLSDLFIKGGSGGTPKSTNKAFYDGDIPFLGISDITKSNGFINNTEKHISSDGLNSSAAWIVSKGAISLAMYASVGKLAILNIDAATSQAFYNMIFDDYDLRDLVYQRLNKANELSEWNKLISTGTQSNLNADKVKNFQMYLPKNHDEIKLISTFFKQIDNTIALHQRKLDLLKEQKKGYLQKMFPKNGEKVPELRFAGFADDWEDRKLGELASFSKGNGYTKNDLVEFGDPIILYGRLYTKYETVIEKVDTFVNKKDKSIISEGSEVIVPASGESSEDISRASVVGKSGIILGGDLNIIKPVNYIDSIFLALTISNGSQQKEMSKRAQGKSVVHLHNSDLKQVNILYPKLEEQQKIGSFFKQLDNTIALHQRKLDLLKEQKKGFLQTMFF